MARQQATDYLHQMRFGVDVINVDGSPRLVDPTNPQAGFSSVTIPEVTIEAVTYKEGNNVWFKKFPGNATIDSDITLIRGVTRSDSSFWEWMLLTAEGTGEYRADVDIKHLHRATALNRGTPPRPIGERNLEVIDQSDPGRIYHAFDCFPTRNKPSTDLDATSGEIAMTEIDLAVERVSVDTIPA